MSKCSAYRQEKRVPLNYWLGAGTQSGFLYGFVNCKKRCTRLAATSDKAYQFLAHGLWFSPGTPASSTTKTGHHDIAEILLKVALKHPKKQHL
jgi:hypothetical protein